jgi:membrane fusion protein
MEVAFGASAQQPLLRTEAIEGLRSKKGRPVALFGIGSWAIVVFMVTILAAILVFLFTTQFSRKETVEGTLQPTTGVATITLSRPGRVAEIYVREGQFVRKGARLMRISLDTTLDAGGATLGGRLADASDQQASQIAAELGAVQSSSSSERAELLARSVGARSQIAHLRESIGLQRERLALEQENLAGLQALQAKGFASATRVREKQVAVLAAQEGLNDTERQIDQLTSDTLTMQAAIDQSAANSLRASAQLRANQAELDMRRAQTDAERGMVLTAPYSGRLVTMRATPGATIEPGMALAMVLPQGAALEAELWVPSRAIGFVTKGDDVRIMFDAFPFQRFGSGRGTVRSISSTPIEPRDLPFKEPTSSEAMYRVKVALKAQSIDAYGKSWSLTPGSRLKADLILERQSLIDWVLDPLQAFRQRSS